MSSLALRVLPTNPSADPALVGPVGGGNPDLTPLELLQQALASPGTGPAKKYLSSTTSKGLSVGVPANPVQATKQVMHNAAVVHNAMAKTLSASYAAAELAAESGAKAAAADKVQEVREKVAQSEQFQKASSELRKRINASPAAQRAFERYQKMKQSPQMAKVASLLTEMQKSSGGGGGGDGDMQ